MNSLDLNLLEKKYAFLSQINRDLYISLLIILITDRNLLLSSTAPTETIVQVSYILKNILDLEYVLIDCSESITIPEDINICILSNIDKTSFEYQQQINPLFDNKICIVVITNTDGYEVSLADEISDKILFRSPHIPMLKFNIESSDEVIVPNSHEQLAILQSKLNSVTLIREIKSYINDIVVFIRNHRMVTGGLPIIFRDELTVMIKAIALINNFDYVTPAIVKLSCEKFLPLHITLVSNCDKEPTLNWGSDLKLVKGFVEKWDQDLVVQDVLKNVQPPI